jgi:hypothetical protein
MSTARMSYVSRRPVSPRYVPEDYPLIRSVADPRIANLPAEDLEAELLRHGIRAEDMEGLFDVVNHALSSAGKAIGSAVSSAAPVVAQVAGKALPGALSGAAAGCALGPWGCLGGALVGGVTSALSGGGPSGGAKLSSPIGAIASALPSVLGAVGGGGGGVASGIASALPAIAGALGGAGAGGGAKPSSPIGAIASALPAIIGGVGGGGGAASGIASALPAIAGLLGGGGGASAAAGGTATNPAGVLLGLVQRPEVLQALMAMTLQSAGRKDIPVGDTPVPVSAFANLIGTLGSKAFGQAEALADPSESLPEYLYKDGTLLVDPAERSMRAAVLLQRLGEVAMPTPRPVRRTSMLTEADEYYDELDAIELDLMEMEGSDYEFDD